MIMTTIKKLMELFLNLRLKYKLLLSFFILTIFPVGFFSLFVFSKSSSILHSYIMYSAEQSFNQTYDFVSYKLYKTMKTLAVISMDDKLNDILMKGCDVSYKAAEQVEDMNNLLKFLKSFQDSEDIYRIKLYVNDGLIYSNENKNILSLSSAEKTTWFKKLKQSTNRILLCPPQYLADDEMTKSEVLSMAVQIRNRNKYDDVIGLLRLDIQKENIVKMLNKANPTEDSITYLIDSSGIIVASSETKAVDSYHIDKLNINKLNKDEGFNEMTMKSQRVFLKHKLIPYTDWSMVTIIPYDALLKEIQNLKTLILYLLLFIGTIAYCLAYIITLSITNRIEYLISKMKEVQEGNMDIIIQNNIKDEIGILFKDFNYMVKKISSLMEQKYRLGQELKNAELKALQSQINPHFLYNTLEMIKWMGYKNHINELESVVNALTNYYKITLNKGREIVTIEDELKHVLYYIQIQNFRFSNKINLKIEVNEEILNYLIPKITLQPIVENSIIHGILQKEDKKGVIIIRGDFNNDTVLLSIEDDGIGMPDEILSDIISCSSHLASKNHFGIYSVNQRIKLLYGEEYGLMFESVQGYGTKVEIQLPKIKQEG